jgi:hypothetical protein
MLLGDGRGLELPDGRAPHEVSPALHRVLRRGWDRRLTISRSGEVVADGDDRDRREPSAAELRYMIEQLRIDGASSDRDNGDTNTQAPPNDGNGGGSEVVHVDSVVLTGPGVSAL